MERTMNSAEAFGLLRNIAAPHFTTGDAAGMPSMAGDIALSVGSHQAYMIRTGTSSTMLLET
jgi:hypothetical protein